MTLHAPLMRRRGRPPAATALPARCVRVARDDRIRVRTPPTGGDRETRSAARGWRACLNLSTLVRSRCVLVLRIYNTDTGVRTDPPGRAAATIRSSNACTQVESRKLTHFSCRKCWRLSGLLELAFGVGFWGSFHQGVAPTRLSVRHFLFKCTPAPVYSVEPASRVCVGLLLARQLQP